MTNTQNFNIRFANTEDAYAIAAVHVASWQEIYCGHIPDEVLDHLSISEREQRWRNLIASGVKVLLIEVENQIVGFASICASRDADTDATQCGEISAIYLHPDVWHLGLGKALCNIALAELAKMGFNEAIVWVLRENQQARKFYAAMGFTPTDDTKAEKYYQNYVLNEVRYRKKFLSNST